MVSKDMDSQFGQLDKDLAVFKALTAARFDVIQKELMWITRITMTQLLCIVLLLGGDKGMKLLQVLKVIQ